MSYLVGQIVRLAITFTDASSALIDPTTVTLKVQLPDNTQITYSGTVVHDSLGKYHQDFTVTEAGTYLFRWDGEGGVSALQEGSFVVHATTLVPQPVTTPNPPEFTYASLAAINAAIAGGTSSVKFADREITYSSMAELILARDLILNYLGLTGVPARRQIRVFTGSGW